MKYYRKCFTGEYKGTDDDVYLVARSSGEEESAVLVFVPNLTSSFPLHHYPSSCPSRPLPLFLPHSQVRFLPPSTPCLSASPLSLN